MTDAESRFVARVMRRKRLFLGLSIAGLLIAAALSVYYVYRVMHDPAFPVGPRGVIVLLILLNARQNLRQYRYAGVLEQLVPSDGPPVAAERPGPPPERAPGAGRG